MNNVIAAATEDEKWGGNNFGHYQQASRPHASRHVLTLAYLAIYGHHHVCQHCQRAKGVNQRPGWVGGGGNDRRQKGRRKAPTEGNTTREMGNIGNGKVETAHVPRRVEWWE